MAAVDDVSSHSAGVALLDACVVINLEASGMMREILLAMPGPVAIVDRVLAETRYDLRAGTRGNPIERVALNTSISDETISVLSPNNDDELMTFIDFAAELDDGEAMTLALAIHRTHTVVTDDRKAIRLLAGRCPLLTTPHLIKTWTEHDQPALTVTRTTMMNIRDYGRYAPPVSHPLRPWWDTAISQV